MTRIRVSLRGLQLYGAFVVFGTASFTGVGCMVEPAAEPSVVDSADSADSEHTGEAMESLSNTSIDLHYEGTCQYLKNCISGFSWACGGYRTDWQGGACSNSDLWLAVPSVKKDELCATKIKVCKGATCVYADVKDIGDSHNWYEASPGLKNALQFTNWSDGNSTTCVNGSGNGPVTMTSGTWSSLVSVSVPGNGGVQFVYVTPNKAGNHVLDYALASASPPSDSLKVYAYWTSNSQPGWHYFPATDATVKAKRLPLYSGSADVNYMFQIQNYTTGSRTFVYRTLQGV